MDKHVRHIWSVNIKNIVAHAVIQPQFVPLMYLHYFQQGFMVSGG